ncbi:SAM-dependent methyltransferase [Pseudonocardia nantongensis]|uniref:SAM-dependent methyltransferase n=1 Tax=Pseudonocardia nantongensis TaxID=1181885 RepID=UPI00397A4A51
MTAAEPTPGRPPARIDTTKASIARVYDAALGGKDNYEIDRATVEKLATVAPEISQFTVDHRAFLVRATRWLAGQAGITQFLDCGSGLPTAENTHQVAQRMQPEARVVYVDDDPTVIAHGQALLEDNNRTMFSPADIFDPRNVVDDPQIRTFLDFDQPIALFQLGTLHHYDDPGRTPQSIMQAYVDALPSGSYVAVSHFLDPEDENSELARRLENVFLHSPMGSGRFRTRAEIQGMFPGLEMVTPGIELCVRWWPDGPEVGELLPAQRCIAGGIGRKP